MFYFEKGIKLNNEITKIKILSKLVKFIVQFNFFCIITHIIFSPVKFSQKILFCCKIKIKIKSLLVLSKFESVKIY